MENNNQRTVVSLFMQEYREIVAKLAKILECTPEKDENEKERKASEFLRRVLLVHVLHGFGGLECPPILEGLFTGKGSRIEAGSILKEFRRAWKILELDTLEEIKYIPDDAWISIRVFLEKYPLRAGRKNEGKGKKITISMLGEVHEATCEQKDEGIFYTPAWMAKKVVESVIYPWITRRVNEHFGTSYDAFPRQAILLPRKRENEKRVESSESVSTLTRVEWCYRQLLIPLKICDPACGTGAFLIATADVLLELFTACLRSLEAAGRITKGHRKDWPVDLCEVDYLPHYLATKVIHGVDIDGGAVEIAKLRMLIWTHTRPNRGAIKTKENIALREGLMNIWRALSKTLKAGNSLVGLFGKNQGRKDLDATLSASLGINTRELSLLEPFHWGLEFEGVFPTGFNIMMGNPPYVRHERLKRMHEDSVDYKAVLNKIHEKMVAEFLEEQPGILGVTMKKTMINDFKLGRVADLSLYFIGRTRRLLAPGGACGYILTSKWLPAAYGRGTRTFLSKAVNTWRIIDLESISVFPGLNVETMILVFAKESPDGRLLYAKPASKLETRSKQSNEAANLMDWEKDLREYSMDQLANDGWNFHSVEDMVKLALIEARGTLVSEMVSSINFGIKTGLNDAFFVDGETRMRLVKQHPFLESYIMPVVRGRDVSAYKLNWSGTWLVHLPKGETRRLFSIHGSSKNVRKNARPRNETAEEASEWFKTEFPGLIKHLAPWKERLEKRCDQGEYYWELRGCTYLDEMRETKILYQEITKEPAFVVDNSGVLLDATTFFIRPKPGLDPWMLVTLFNSPVSRFVMAANGTRLGAGTIRYKKKYFLRSRLVLPPSEHSEDLKQLSKTLHEQAIEGGNECKKLQDLVGEYIEECTFGKEPLLYLERAKEFAGGLKNAGK